jgi:hypothetical protein
LELGPAKLREVIAHTFELAKLNAGRNPRLCIPRFHLSYQALLSFLFLFLFLFPFLFPFLFLSLMPLPLLSHFILLSLSFLFLPLHPLPLPLLGFRPLVFHLTSWILTIGSAVGAIDFPDFKAAFHEHPDLFDWDEITGDLLDAVELALDSKNQDAIAARRQYPTSPSPSLRNSSNSHPSATATPASSSGEVTASHPTEREMLEKGLIPFAC